jgi:hypothetical protein
VCGETERDNHKFICPVFRSTAEESAASLNDAIVALAAVGRKWEEQMR